MFPVHQFNDEPTAEESVSRQVNEDARMSLLVIGDGFVATHPLPASGAVLVGRSLEADIRIDVACISRRHALIHVGSSVRVEDLGSVNGTCLRDVRLERGRAATVESGDIIELGSTMLVLQSGHTAARPRRIWDHPYFEARLEEECARAETMGGSFALVRIRTFDKHATAEALHKLLLGALRPCDVLAAYGPDDYEVVVTGASPDESHSVVTRLCAPLSPDCEQVGTGVAYYPRDGRTPEALMAKACADLEGVEVPEETSANVVIESPLMRRLHKVVSRVAAGTINTLILGETGVGKEIIAERIHALSSRVEKPLLRLNCAALTESLLESELFGHERGAFTGATSAKPGLLETADEGTVFLDEIGDMPASIQAKLLRTLEDRTVRRVGGLEARPVDIRIVAATHRDLEAEVALGNFRQDLFFRIAGVTLVVPPLRERVEEIGPLAEGFLTDACRRQRIWKAATLTDDALEQLRRYDWPGNIRELRNVIERAFLLSTNGVITTEHLPMGGLGRTYRVDQTPPPKVSLPLTPRREENHPPVTSDRDTTAIEDTVDLKREMNEFERDLIRDALSRAGGNQKEAAKLLGMSRRTLITRIEKYGLPRPRKRA